MNEWLKICDKFQIIVEKHANYKKTIGSMVTPYELRGNDWKGQRATTARDI